MPSLPEFGIYLALVLFVTGLLGVLARKNILLVMLSLEILLNSANLAFVCASRITNTLDGQVAVTIVMAVAACEAAVGLALVIAMFRKVGSLDVDDLRILRG